MEALSLLCGPTVPGGPVLALVCSPHRSAPVEVRLIGASGAGSDLSPPQGPACRAVACGPAHGGVVQTSLEGSAPCRGQPASGRGHSVLKAQEEAH